MKHRITRIWDAISYPFLSIAILIDESRNQNLDGEWNDYWARKNEKAELRALRKKYKADKKAIKNKYMVTMTHY
jgi:hypothetical protein